MGKKNVLKLIVFLLLVFAIYLVKYYGLQNYFTLEYMKEHQLSFANYYKLNQIQAIFIFFWIYVFVCAISIPAGAALMTFLAGALFGLGSGILIVSFASTIGATVAFLISRFLLRDWVQSKFSKSLKVVNSGIEKEGALYLLTLRLIPIFPFSLINVVMGPTNMGILTYFFISQLGMLPGTTVAVNAGQQLSQIHSLKGVFSFELIASFF